MGKARTSVGPSPSIHFSLSPAIVSSSTALMQSSASGCTRIRSSTNRLSPTRWSTSRVWPDSLSTSMLTPDPSLASCRPRAALLGARVVVVVGRHDLADQPVPDHVVGGQPAEADVLDVVEDPLDHAQAGMGAAG